MAKALQQEDAKEYGQQVAEEQNAEALAAGAEGATADNPIVATPEATPAATPQPAPQQAPPPVRGGVQPRNLMQIVPTSLLFRQKQGRLPSQQDYDIGQLWRALEQDQNTDPLVRAIAKKLLRES